MSNVCYALLHRFDGSTTLEGITFNEDVAEQWRETKNKGWEMSGNHAPSYVYETWPVSTTVDEALSAKDTKQAMNDAKRELEAIERLSPLARQMLKSTGALQ